MKKLFEHEVITTDDAFSFEPILIDHRKFKKWLHKILLCEDVKLVVYTNLNEDGKMLSDRVFCTTRKDIKL